MFSLSQISRITWPASSLLSASTELQEILEHQLESAKAKLAANPIDRMAQLLVDSRTQALADEAAHVETVNRILEQGFELPPYQTSDTPFVAFNPFPKLP